MVALSSVDSVLEKTWESLHTGSWADASDGIRKLYSHASLFKVNNNINIVNDNSIMICIFYIIWILDAIVIENCLWWKNFEKSDKCYWYGTVNGKWIQKRINENCVIIV